MRKKELIPSLSIINITSKIYKVYLKNFMETMILVSKEYLQMAFIFSNPFRATILRLLSFLRHTCSAMRRKKHAPSLSNINIPQRIFKVCVKICMNAMTLVSKWPNLHHFCGTKMSGFLSYLRHNCSAMRKKGNIPSLSIIHIHKEST